MKILVTGSTGLVGTNLVRELVKNHDVVGVSKSLGVNLLDREKIQEVIRKEKPEVIYHLAANAAEARGQISPIDMTDNNLNIFLNTLVPFIKNKGKRFIYVSSISVYGETPTPYSEDYHPEPKDIYGINKLACESILKIMAKVYGFEYVIVRLHNIYGPHQNMNDPYRNVVALFIRRLLENKPYKLYGEGKMYRQFSYIDDVVEILVDTLDKYTNKTFNLGDDNVVTIKQLSNLLREISGVEVPIEYEDARPQEIIDFTASHTLQNNTSVYMSTPLREGLTKTWNWAKEQPLSNFIQKYDEI